MEIAKTKWRGKMARHGTRGGAASTSDTSSPSICATRRMLPRMTLGNGGGGKVGARVEEGADAAREAQAAPSAMDTHFSDAGPSDSEAGAPKARVMSSGCGDASSWRAAGSTMVGRSMMMGPVARPW